PVGTSESVRTVLRRKPYPILLAHLSRLECQPPSPGAGCEAKPALGWTIAGAAPAPNFVPGGSAWAGIAPDSASAPARADPRIRTLTVLGDTAANSITLRDPSFILFCAQTLC